jgi:hypothetical protein
VVDLGKNMGAWPGYGPKLFLVTWFVSKVWVGPLSGVVAQPGKAVEVYQPELALGSS